MIIAPFVVVFAVRHRHATPAAAAVAMVAVGVGLWAAEDAIGGFLTNLQWRTNLALIRFPAMKVTVLGFCWLSWTLIYGDARVSRRLVALLLVEPTLVTVAAATNHWHGWLFAATELVGQPSMLRIYPGPLFYVQSAYTYAIILVMLVGALRALRTASDLHRRQLGTILLAAAFPIAGNIVTLVQFANGGGGDYAVVGFGLTGLLTGWAVFRQGLLRLVPIARGLVLERISDAVVVLDRDGRVLDLNPAAARLVRSIRPDQPSGLIGLPADQLLPDEVARRWLTDGEHSMALPERRIDLDTRSSDLTDRQGRPMGRVVVARDVTELNHQKRALRAALRERDELAEALRHQAFHDNLTGLANRALFAQRLADEYARARRRGSGGGAVAMLVDLDDFKPVNDRLGHHFGDLLLQEVAGRLRAALREVDTVARLGGDEFAIVLAQPQRESVTAVAGRLIEALQVPFVIQGEELRVTASIGVAVDPDATASPDQLLRDADAAMYQVKRRGKGSFLLFEQPRG
jgi:diguanylate cyclase (GGDEF)-like protein